MRKCLQIKCMVYSLVKEWILNYRLKFKYLFPHEEYCFWGTGGTMIDNTLEPVPNSETQTLLFRREGLALGSCKIHSGSLIVGACGVASLWVNCRLKSSTQKIFAKPLSDKEPISRRYEELLEIFKKKETPLNNVQNPGQRRAARPIQEVPIFFHFHRNRN